MTSPSKREIAEALLERGSVFLHLDPRHEGVSIPAWLRRQPQVVLQVGLDMPIPIPDLAVDDDGVVATLSFNRTPHRCVVPWDAIFALVGDDGRGRVFLESMPPEIRREVDREASEPMLEGDLDEDDDVEPRSHDDASGENTLPDLPGEPDDGSDARPAADVIPMWPRSVGGRTARPAGNRPSTPPARSSAPSKPPEGPRPRPPHPHLRRVK